MKKKAAVLLLLIFLLGLCGCAPAQLQSKATTPQHSVPTTPVSTTTAIPTTTPPTTGVRIVMIGYDREHPAFDLAIEEFYENEKYIYSFSAMMSSSIFVGYSDGTYENIIDALNAGRATLNDLKRFGFSYYTVPK